MTEYLSRIARTAAAQSMAVRKLASGYTIPPNIIRLTHGPGFWTRRVLASQLCKLHMVLPVMTLVELDPPLGHERHLKKSLSAVLPESTRIRQVSTAHVLYNVPGCRS